MQVSRRRGDPVMALLVVVVTVVVAAVVVSHGCVVMVITSMVLAVITGGRGHGSGRSGRGESSSRAIVSSWPHLSWLWWKR